MLSRVEGMSAEALASGVDFPGGTLGDFLDNLEGRVGVNVGANVGHCALRRHVLGDEASVRAATDDEIAAMQDLLRGAFRDGAVGFTSSQLEIHQAHDGRGVPSNYAAPEELIALAGVLKEFGRGQIEFIPRSFLVGYDDEDRALIRAMAGASGRPVHLNTLTQMPHAPDGWSRSLEFAEQAIADGLEIHPMFASNRQGAHFQLGSTFLFDEMPSFRTTLTLPPAERAVRLRDPAVRAQMRRELADPTGRSFVVPWSVLRVEQVQHDRNRRFVDRSVTEVAEAWDADPLDAFLDLSLDEDLETQFVLAAPPDPRRRAATETLIHPPFVMPGSSDGAPPLVLRRGLHHAAAHRVGARRAEPGGGRGAAHEHPRRGERGDRARTSDTRGGGRCPGDRREHPRDAGRAALRRRHAGRERSLRHRRDGLRRRDRQRPGAARPGRVDGRDARTGAARRRELTRRHSRCQRGRSTFADFGAAVRRLVLGRTTGRGVGLAGVLATAGLVAASLTAVPGAADANPGASPVQFTTCGSSLWTVPAGVTSVTADVFGAAGGSGSALSGGTRGLGGGGGEAMGTFAVTPGEVLQINVACAGGDANARSPGLGGRGGNGDADGGNGVPGVDVPSFTATGGGGGASDIRQGGTALSDRVIVAGGGGGSGDAGTSGTGAAGGGGGFPTGQPGGGTGSAPSSCFGGRGGTPGSGGAGGATSGYCDIAGITATGPTGADGQTSADFASGPGGGGYTGGGSGATEDCDSGVTGGGGGGGGASFFAASVTNQFAQTGVDPGAGRVVLTLVTPTVASFTC
jgi:hypothetical protein